MASPVVDVPVTPFFFGTLFGIATFKYYFDLKFTKQGVAPPSFLFIHAGTTLQQMTNANVVWSWDSIAWLTFFALISLAPVLYKQMRKYKIE